MENASAGVPLDVERYRRELLAHCYRMLGSLHDAEDAVQEALVRAWGGAAGFEGRSSLRAWLHAIATRVCLDQLRGARGRTLPPRYGPAARDADAPPLHVDEPIWLEPFPDDSLPADDPGPEARYAMRESVALAFLAALQRVPPRQRAALLLCDVLGHSAAEAAAMLDTTVAAVNGALRRSRAAIDAAIPRGTPSLDRSDEAEVELLARYVRAWEGGDVRAIAALLREDAILSMPPDVLWFRGREAIAAYLAHGPLAGDPRGRFRLLPLGANAQPAFALYRRGEDGIHRALALMVLALRGGAVAEITGFLDARLFAQFGVATELGQGLGDRVG